MTDERTTRRVRFTCPDCDTVLTGEPGAIAVCPFCELMLDAPELSEPMTIAGAYTASDDLTATADILATMTDYVVSVDNTGGGVMVGFVRSAVSALSVDPDAPDRCVAFSETDAGVWSAGLYADWSDPDDLADGRMYDAPVNTMDAERLAAWLRPLADGWLA